jgi:hypothetical protein
MAWLPSTISGAVDAVRMPRIPLRRVTGAADGCGDWCGKSSESTLNVRDARRDTDDIVVDVGITVFDDLCLLESATLMMWRSPPRVSNQGREKVCYRSGEGEV